MIDRRERPENATLARASPVEWWILLIELLQTGRRQLVEAAAVLVLGFAAGLLALETFAELADGVMERKSAWLDAAVLVWLRHLASPALDVVASLLTLFGAEALLLVVLVVFGGLLLAGRWGAAMGLIATGAGAVFLNLALKYLFQRPRPAPADGFLPGQGFAFPSGHAMLAAAVYLFLAYLGWRLLPHGLRILCTLLLLLLIGLVGLSRLYLGVHYLTDVLAGFIVGFLWADAVIVGSYVIGRARAVRRRLRIDTAAAGPNDLSAT